MSSSSQSPTKQQGARRRAGSIQQALQGIETSPRHHLAGAFAPNQSSSSSDVPSDSSAGKRKFLKRRKGAASGYADKHVSLWKDIKTMRWMRRPSSSFKLLVIPWILYFNWMIFAPKVWNPFHYLLMIQYRINGGDGEGLYTKGYGDIAFVCYNVILFSFIRQSLTIYVLQPLARKLGIRKQAKIDRFNEQGYAIIYFTCTGLVGLTEMYGSQFWYFNTTPYWTEYPHWRLTGLMKSYYLMQYAYWFQQLLVLILRLEKPRKDFAELVVHHIVTLWLIGWSYLVNLTPIGNAVFITMDISDVFLALAKAIKYTGRDTLATCTFVFFIGVWSYLRHYLNIKLLWSVLTEFELSPKWTHEWNPKAGVYFAPWMKMQIFAPMMLLQLVNLFWYFLIWRIALRAIFGSEVEDDRSDDEGDDEKAPVDDKDD